MKKLNYFILLMTVMSFIVNCGANPSKLMNKTLDQVYIGMPLSEFKEKVDKEILVEANQQITVYKVHHKTYNDAHVVLSGNGWRQDIRFFYFIDGKLNSIDMGERAVDYRIKID